jgi:hypothetical protein
VEIVRPLERPSDGYGYNNPRVTYRAQADEIAIVYQTGGYGGATYRLIRLGADWSVRGEPALASQYNGTNITDAALTATADGYAFVYAGADDTLYYVRFDEDGQRQGPDVAVTNLSNLEYLSKTLLWDGEIFTTAWSDFTNIRLVRFDATGALVGESLISANDPGVLTYMPILAQGPWVGIIWEELEQGSLEDGIHRVHFTVVDDRGAPLREPLVFSEQGIYPWLASDGNGYLASWREGDIWDPDIAFLHIGCPVPLTQ